MDDHITPEQVPESEGQICFKQMCMKIATWKILKKYYCYDHMAMAEWLPGVPNHSTGPRGKKNQLKFKFPEATYESEETRVERQGKEDAQGDATQRAGGDLRPGESVLPVGRSGVEQERELMGSKQPAQADSIQVSAPVGPGPVHEDEIGIPDRDREEGSPFEEVPEEDGEAPSEFGGEW